MKKDIQNKEDSLSKIKILIIKKKEFIFDRNIDIESGY